MKEEFVSDKTNFAKIFEQIGTSEIWKELARRLNVQFGKIQMSIHEGQPSKYANIDIRVSTTADLEMSTK
jgi:hypothetical protein